MKKLLLPIYKILATLTCLLLISCANDPLMKILLGKDGLQKEQGDELAVGAKPTTRNKRVISKHLQEKDALENSYLQAIRASFKRHSAEKFAQENSSNKQEAYEVSEIDNTIKVASLSRRNMFEQLQKGMPSFSVRQMLGQPSYVDIISAPQFGNERWSYIDDPNNKKEYNILFDHGKLSAWWYH